jgi:hypothetical protein
MKGEEFLARTLSLQREIAATKKLEEQLEQSITRAMGVRQQKGQALQQQSQERVGLLQQRRDALSSTIHAEQARLQGSKEGFGMLLPHQKEGIVNLAKKAASGKDLSRPEIEFARQHGDLFGDVIRKQGARRAGPEFDEVTKLLGLDRRQKEATVERQKIEAQLDATLTVDAQSLSEQLTSQLVPQVLQAIQQLGAATSADLRRLTNQQRVQAATLARP